MSSHHMMPTRTMSHSALPQSFAWTSRCNIWQKQTQLLFSQLEPSVHFPLSDPWNWARFKTYSHEQIPQSTKYLPEPRLHFITSLTWYFFSVSGDLHHTRRWQHQPFLHSTYVYCKEKHIVLHTQALPVGLSNTCLHFHLSCEVTLLKNLFLRCHHR
jgi:hypothetical protein